MRRLKFTLALAAATYLLTLLSIANFASRRERAADLVTHTYEVLRASQTVMLECVDIETGFRGYALTQNQVFLEPYQRGNKTVELNLQRLKNLVQDNPVQVSRVQKLQQTVDRLRDMLQPLLRSHSQSDLTILKSVMDSIRLQSDSINDAELHLLNQRQNEFAQSDKSTTASIAILSLVGLAFLIWSGISDARNTRLILAQHKQEAAIREAEHLKMIAEAMPLAIWSTDAQGNCDYVNQIWLDVNGASIEQALGLGWLEYVHPDDRGIVLDTWKRFIDDDHPFTEEFRMGRPDAYRWFLTRGTKVRSNNGELIKAVCVCTDINDKKEQSALLEKLVQERTADLVLARKIAEDSLAAKSRFLATVSHEVRTPMASVIGFMEIIRDTSKDEEIRSSASIAFDSSARLLRILNDLLDASKLNAGKINLEKRRFAIKAAIGDLIQISALEARKKGISLDSIISSDVPELVCGDELRVRQILSNLLFNAVKFTERGKVSMNARVVARKDGAITIRFEVDDTGIGMSSEQQERLFKPFEQAVSSTARVHGGTGLGLSIAKELVELMHGSIWVESKEQEGSRFFVEISFNEGDCA
jgi:PAS domain S-box-containing protein